VSVALQPGDFARWAADLIRASLVKPLGRFVVDPLMLQSAVIIGVKLDKSNPNGRSGPQTSRPCALALMI
jgi:hypothetical protein